MNTIPRLALLLALFCASVVSAAPSSATANVGQSATFSVTADGTTPFTYQWKKNGVNIPTANAATYSIASLVVTDAGAYTVQVGNSAGSATSDTATLIVNGPPGFSTQPTSLAVNVGQPASFTVVAVGTPPPTLQWQKNGVNITGATSATYTIANCATTDAGSYSCIATNAAGSKTSTAATLTVNVVPPSNLQVTVTIAMSTGANAGRGLAVNLTAAATATSYQWFRNGRPIPGATGPSYTVANAALNIGSSYSATARTGNLTIKSPVAVSLDRNR